MGSPGVVNLAAARVSVHSGRALPRGRLYRLPHVAPVSVRLIATRTLLPALLSAKRNGWAAPCRRHVPAAYYLRWKTPHATGAGRRCTAGPDAAAWRQAAADGAFR